MQNDAGESTELSIDETLQQRGNRYGTFSSHSEISQSLQDSIFAHAKAQGRDLEPYMKEALILIAHKIGRIVNGDPHYDDNWRDIAGYSQLVVDILHGKNT